MTGTHQPMNVKSSLRACRYGTGTEHGVLRTSFITSIRNRIEAFSAFYLLKLGCFLCFCPDANFFFFLVVFRRSPLIKSSCLLLLRDTRLCHIPSFLSSPFCATPIQTHQIIYIYIIQSQHQVSGLLFFGKPTDTIGQPPDSLPTYLGTTLASSIFDNYSPLPKVPFSFSLS